METLLTIDEAFEAAAFAVGPSDEAHERDRRTVACINVLGPELPVHELVPAAVEGLLPGLLRAGVRYGELSAHYVALRESAALAALDDPGWPPFSGLRLGGDELAAIRDDGARALADMLTWLDGNGWRSTADVARIVAGSRCGVAWGAVASEAFEVAHLDDADLIVVAGRQLRIVSREGRAALACPERRAAMRSVALSTHRARWQAAAQACGIRSRSIADAARRMVREGVAAW